MTTLNKLNSYFVLKDLIRVHPYTISVEDVRKKSEFSLMLTNLPLDTNGRYLISIGNAIEVIVWIISKSCANYRNLQYTIFYFKTKESMEAAKNGETYFLDKKRLIWTDPNAKLCFTCQVLGHQSQNYRKNHLVLLD
ncbi:12635_t:CDS:1, partial [Funneliformis caledonium]